MNNPNQMLTEVGAADLAQAFPRKMWGEAQMAASQLLTLMTVSQWTDHFGVFINDEKVLLPSRLRFERDSDSFVPGSNTSLMVRALQLRSNDGYQRQRAVRDLLTDIRSWTAPFVVALIGEYIVEILDDIDAASTPVVVAELATFIAANPAYWATTKRRVQSYFHVYYNQVPRSNYSGFRLVDKLEAELASRAS